MFTLPTILALTLSLTTASPLTLRQPHPTSVPAPSCTTTLEYNPTFHIEVMYSTTVTATSSVDCGGCALTIVGKEEAPAETPAPEMRARGERRQVEGGEEGGDPFATRTVWETECAVSTAL
ncbi:hypothetical protein BDZ85DRAFT_122266 [Elsinoe ampelina]|uniref:Uncharacterized protein n=1 Tax=Elsinoe ampelina TaxID=302913 RepID=A0A6A6GBP8_9PEZI|nr:hypothetical protein BDZ85DRAFT_122266 [Elsinoe ampelina]